MHATLAGIRFPLLAFAPADHARSAPLLSPINQRRLKVFNANRRGVWSLWIFLVLFVLTMFAELIANDRPLVVGYKGETLFPVGRHLSREQIRRFPRRNGLIAIPSSPTRSNANGWMLWPPIRYSYSTVDESLSGAAPSKPSWLQTAESAVPATRPASPIPPATSAISTGSAPTTRAVTYWPG